MYHFWQKRYPLHIPSWYRPLHIPAVNVPSFKLNKSQSRNVFATFSQLKNASLGDPLGLFYRPKWQISVPFHIRQILEFLTLHIRKAWKKKISWKKNVPLSGGASPYRPWQGVSFPRIDKSPSAVLFVHYAFVFSPKYSILMPHCFHWVRMLGSPPPRLKKSLW